MYPSLAGAGPKIAVIEGAGRELTPLHVVKVAPVRAVTAKSLPFHRSVILKLPLTS
jgi:hypothetical protein